MSEESKKRGFYALTVANFIAVLIYACLTPIMSDDISYGDVVATANNFFDLFVQEYHHYIDHSGRSVAHILVRLFLFVGTKSVFNVVSALVFTALSLLIYVNVREREKYDIRLYGIIIIMLWLFDPAISNTVFWQTGACNYLFTTTIIMGFITLFRKGVHDKKEGTIWSIVGMFVCGVICGWCNENTSGAVIVFIALETIYFVKKNKRTKDKPKKWMISSLIGALIGFAFMILAPGNYGRLGVLEESHTGIVAMAARFLKITLNIKNGYFVLVATYLVLLCLIRYMDRGAKRFVPFVHDMLFFGFLFLITDYALIMIPSSEIRSYYGAGIFLMTGIAQGVSKLLTDRNTVIKSFVSSLAIVLGLFLVFTYIEEGANLARIKREFDERNAYFQQMADEGAEDVTAPMLRPGWETRFSAAYDSDIEEGPDFWINWFYANHYGFDTVTGVERENWDEY